jgi:hypothetical protein
VGRFAVLREVACLNAAARTTLITYKNMSHAINCVGRKLLAIHRAFYGQTPALAGIFKNLQTSGVCGHRKFKRPFSRLLDVSNDHQAVKRARSLCNPMVASTSPTISLRGALDFHSIRETCERPRSHIGSSNKPQYCSFRENTGRADLTLTN